eukprot:365584-Chlamydomonas_euryale.AAC.12
MDVYARSPPPLPPCPSPPLPPPLCVRLLPSSKWPAHATSPGRSTPKHTPVSSDVLSAAPSRLPKQPPKSSAWSGTRNSSCGWCSPGGFARRTTPQPEDDAAARAGWSMAPPSRRNRCQLGSRSSAADTGL